MDYPDILKKHKVPELLEVQPGLYCIHLSYQDAEGEYHPYFVDSEEDRKIWIEHACKPLNESAIKIIETYLFEDMWEVMYHDHQCKIYHHAGYFIIWKD